MRGLSVWFKYLFLGLLVIQASAAEETMRPAAAIDYAEAAQGSPEAQYRLGSRYLNGAGIAQSHADAVYWFRRAAENGHPGAQLSLGTLYMEGIGVSRDYFTAVEWFFRAASQGSSDAQYRVGVMYAHGLGVMRQDGKAEHWLRKAAARGHDLAQHELTELLKRRVKVLGNYPLPDLRRVKGSGYG
jgi:TPR repeat protein